LRNATQIDSLLNVPRQRDRVMPEMLCK